MRRLARLPLHYPAHLTTSILAPMLNPHIRVPADDPDPDAVEAAHDAIATGTVRY